MSEITLVARLREHDNRTQSFLGTCHPNAICSEAADEIERLRGIIYRRFLTMGFGDQTEWEAIRAIYDEGLSIYNSILAERNNNGRRTN